MPRTANSGQFADVVAAQAFVNRRHQGCTTSRADVSLKNISNVEQIVLSIKHMSLVLSNALHLQPKSVFRSVEIHAQAAGGPADLLAFIVVERRCVDLYWLLQDLTVL